MENTTAKRRTLSFANITSVVALVVALGGTSYAAVQLPKNSVGAPQIKTNAVAGAEIKNNAVRSGEVRNGSLSAADIAPTEREKLKGARAYGVFRSNGTLVGPRSRNVTVSKLAGDGRYCVTPTAASGINAARSTIVATPDFIDGSGFNHIVQVFRAVEGDASCPNGFYLLTRNDNSGWADTDIAVSFMIP